MAAFQEALRAAEGGTCRYELARAQGKEANYILRIESLSPPESAGPSLWLIEPLRWFMSSIVSTKAYERVNPATAPVAH